MIESLYIKNFTIIDELHVEFNDGMNVLSGETGAGKSIIIDAIGQLAGNRAQTSFIKEGEDKAIIEGVFSINDNKEIIDLLDELDIETEDNQLFISKTFNISGKSSIKINYRPVSNSLVKVLMSHLIDIHNQFDTQLLFNESNHVSYLDNYIGSKQDELLIAYRTEYNKYRKLLKKYDYLVQEEYDDEQIDFYKNQLKEIDAFDFTEFDEDSLIEERNKLKNIKKINESLTSFHQIMKGTVLDRFKEALYYLNSLDEYSDFQELNSKINDLYYNLEDTSEAIDDYSRSINYSSEREEELMNLITTYNGLKRKYGSSVSLIMDKRDEIESKINNYNNRDNQLEELKDNISKQKDLVTNIASKIHNNRLSGIKSFTKEIENELQSLYLPNVKFVIDINEVDFNSNGIDEVTFLISTNLGETPKPMKKVASGGEMSRIMLALKTIFSKKSSNNTIIFDEADTGVSGRVAESIGSKMKLLSKNNQILCITHLAQVACFSDHHYLISKTEKDNKTSVSIKELNNEESVNELAKLISGATVTKESLDHAKKLKKLNA